MLLPMQFFPSSDKRESKKKKRGEGERHFESNFWKNINIYESRPKKKTRNRRKKWRIEHVNLKKARVA